MNKSERQRDAALFEDFLPFAMQDYESLRYTNDKGIKEAFLRDDIDEPDLRYGEAELVHAGELCGDLHDFETVVLTMDDDVVRRAYQPKVAEVRSKLKMLDAAAEGDDVAVLEHCVGVYGEPQQVYFRHALRDLKERLDRVEEGFGNRDSVKKALHVLRPMVQTDADAYPWDNIVLPGIKEYEDSVALDAQQIRDLFVQAFDRYNIEEWQAVVDRPGDRITFNTNLDVRTVFIPSDEDLMARKYPLTRERVEAIIAHEIATHVLRRENGAKSPLALLGLGLDGYLRAEEGIATYNEQRVGGSRHFAGGLGYLAVGWVRGLDGTPRTFRGLFDVLVPYLLISGLEHALVYDEPVDYDQLESKVIRNAWARCVRVFRGTSGRTPGCCFTKDIVYLEGNIRIWQLITEKPAWEQFFTLGKFDPTNPEHVGILTELGMVPAELSAV